LRFAVAEVVRKVALKQGKTNTARKTQLSFGQSPPADDQASVPIWVRDGWECTQKTVRDDAIAAKTDSATVFVWLPRQDDDQLKTALAEHAAASDTISSRPVPTTADGQDARAGMESRRQSAQARVASLVTQVLRNATAFQGGGNEVAGASLEDNVRAAAVAALDRRFPQFAMADQTEWPKVILQARQGAADPLSPVGDKGEVTSNPVCKEVLTFLPGSWTKGSEVRKKFAEAPYGWPQDSIDGAMLALVAAGAVAARQNGEDVAVKNLNPGAISKTDFRREYALVTATARITVRALMAEAGMKVDPGDEGPTLPIYLDSLIKLAETAGGDPPLPERPNTTVLKQLRTVSGNQLIQDGYDKRDELKAWRADWTRAAELAADRVTRWRRLQELLGLGESIQAMHDLAKQAAAVNEARTLLTDPDPIAPLIQVACEVLRTALSAAHSAYLAAHQSGEASLAADANWSKLEGTKATQILVQVGLTPPVDLLVGTENELVSALGVTPISEWEARSAAVPSRISGARELAAKELAPKATRYVPPQATLDSPDAVNAYVDELRDELLGRVADGPVVI
jgi:hypothetical protein